MMTLRLPSLASVLAILLAALAFAWVVRECSIPEPPQAAPVASMAPLRDSLLRARVLDSIRLRSWADSLVALRGDSLRIVFSRRAAALRPRIVHLPVSVDTVRDSVVVASSDVRTILLADSACVVRADSLAGELVQARYDAQECSEELQKRPTSCSGWSAFGIGFGVGAAATAGACLLVR